MDRDQIASDEYDTEWIDLDDSPFGATRIAWRIRRSDAHGVLEAYTFYSLKIEDDGVGALIRTYISDRRAGVMFAMSEDRKPSVPYGFTVRGDGSWDDASLTDVLKEVSLAILHEVSHQHEKRS